MLEGAYWRLTPTGPDTSEEVESIGCRTSGILKFLFHDRWRGSHVLPPNGLHLMILPLVVVELQPMHKHFLYQVLIEFIRNLGERSTVATKWITHDGEVVEATSNMTVIVIHSSPWSSVLMITSNGEDFEKTGEARVRARDTSSSIASEGAW